MICQQQVRQHTGRWHAVGLLRRSAIHSGQQPAVSGDRGKPHLPVCPPARAGVLRTQ